MPYKDPERQRQYQREYVAARRKTWLEEHGPCAKCGSSSSLQVDHVDPAEKVTHLVWTWSEARREAELAKCQVLCRDCHLKKTVAQRPQRARHGSGDGRLLGGCHCDQCREYARLRKRESRARLAVQRDVAQ